MAEKLKIWLVRRRKTKGGKSFPMVATLDEPITKEAMEERCEARAAAGHPMYQPFAFFEVLPNEETNPGRYSETGFPELLPGEPYHVILGRDPNAVAAIQAHAKIVGKAGDYKGEAQLRQDACELGQWQDLNPKLVDRPE